MKGKHIILLVIVLCLIVMIPLGTFLFGLAANAGRIAGLLGLTPTEPMKQYGSLWLSEDPYLSIEVAEEGSYKACTAFAMLDGEKTEVFVGLEPGKLFTIRRLDELAQRDLRGTIRSWDETEVLIDVTEDEIFGGAYDTITLRRAEG